MEKFTENSLKERDAIKKSNILNIFKDTMIKKNYDFSYEYITAYDGFDHYDAMQCFVKYENDKSEYLRFLIEVKVRSEVYDEMFLEFNKWKEMNKIKLLINGKFKLLYVNYTPEGTFIFDITEIEKYQLVTRTMKQYSSKESKSINKKVFLLPKEMAKIIPFVYNPDEFKPNYNEELNKTLETKKLYDIFGQIQEIDRVNPQIHIKKTKNIAKIISTSNITQFEFDKMMAEKEREFDDFLYDVDKLKLDKLKK